MVRLIGDQTEHLKMWAEAERAADKGAKAIEASTDKITAGAVASGALAAQMIGNVSRKLEAVGRSAINAFSEQEDADVALTSSLEANGRAVRNTFKEYQAFSSELQKVTKYADESVIALLTQAETFNLTGEAARKATKDAIALAALPGSRGSAQSLIRLTAAMATGDAERAMMFARMVPQLSRIKDETKFLSEYQRLVEAGFKAEEAAAKTYSGAIAQASNVTNDLGEDFGKVAADAIKPWIARFKEVIAVVKGFDPAVKELMVVVAGAVVGLVGFMLAFNNIATTIQVLGPLVSKLFLGMATATGLTTGGFVAIAAAVVLLAAALYKVNPAVQEFNAAMKQGDEINERWIARIKEGTRAIVDRANALSGTEKQVFLQSGLEEAQEQLAGYERGLVAAVKELENLEWEHPIWGNKLVAEARVNVADFKKRVAETKAGVEQLAKMKGESVEVGEVGMSAEQLKKIEEGAKELTKSLQDQLAVFEMLPRQAAIYKMELEGATETQLAEARAIDETLTAWEEHHQAMDQAAADNLRHVQSVEQVIESLERQAVTWGMTATQIAVHDAQIAFGLGQITQAQLAAVEAGATHVDALTKEQVLMSRGKAITEQFKDSFEKIRDRREELNELLIAGKINLDTYNKAMNDLMKTEAARESANAGTNFGTHGSATAFSATKPIMDALEDAPAFTAAKSIEDVMRMTTADAAAKSIQDAITAGVTFAGEDPIPLKPLLGGGSDTFSTIAGLPAPTYVPQARDVNLDKGDESTEQQTEELKKELAKQTQELKTLIQVVRDQEPIFVGSIN